MSTSSTNPLVETVPLPELQARDAVVDEVIAAVLSRLETQRHPSATYRVQLNTGCTFSKLHAYVSYLYTLGICDLYTSPFLQARPGSTHGYDIVDHGAINSEIGTLAELRALRSALREHHMGLVADVVPNHMCASPKHNRWWLDVLENGPSSAYACYFDIDWHPLKPDLVSKVLLPVLGAQYGEELEAGKLQVHYEDGTFILQYYEHRIPLAPESYAQILSPPVEDLRRLLGEEHDNLMEYLSILTAMKNLPAQGDTDPGRRQDRRREKEVIKRRLHDLLSRSPDITRCVAERVRQLNGQLGDPHSFDPLDALLQEQPYRLAYWRVAADEINYRRFFDINDLAAICMENPEVFVQTHKVLFQLLEEGVITGLRIDHPDGLYDPQLYLSQVQERYFLMLCREAWQRNATLLSEDAEVVAEQWQRLVPHFVELWRSATQIPGSPLARPLYVIVEKILAHDELLPEDWPVAGTVGYEFLNTLNGLFVDRESERELTTFYGRFSKQSFDFRELMVECKRLIVQLTMSGELSVLGYRLDRISERNRRTRDFTLSSLTHALQELIVAFQVYRTYVQPEMILERDVHYVERAVERAKRRNPAVNASLFDFLRDVLLLRYHDNDDEHERLAIQRFVGKFQQLTGPIMAKAVEDTAFYRFNRLASLNEVGGDPSRFGTTLNEFHRFHQNRLPRFTLSVNATSTHDTKRSEDVRARIHVLSEVPRQWRECVRRWNRINQRHKSDFDGLEAPSRNAEYLLYQTLIGIWPDRIPQGEERSHLVERVQQHMLKVAREAKVHSSWISPNEAYESGVLNFVARLFQDDKRKSILPDLDAFARKIAEHGRWNSLTQLVVKIGASGVPDFFQGSEVWNLTLVDPDNRQPIEFERPRNQLDQLLTEMANLTADVSHSEVVEAWLSAVLNQSPAEQTKNNSDDIGAFLVRLLEQRRNGLVKLFVTLLGLRMRRHLPELFTAGSYFPLETKGTFADRIIAFARQHEGRLMLVVAPRLTVKVVGLGGPPPLGEVWGDTSVVLSNSLLAENHTAWELRELFSRDTWSLDKGPLDSTTTLRVADILRTFPIAMAFSH